jgi:predicted nucleic acid-binding protein
VAGYDRAVLLDNSAWARVLLGRLPRHRLALWREAVAADEVYTCPPFELEALYSARDERSYDELELELGGLRLASADDQTWFMAQRAQRELSRAPGVSHRVKPIDLLIATIAAQHSLAVLHYDADFDVIAQHSSLDFGSLWIAERGSMS